MRPGKGHLDDGWGEHRVGIRYEDDDLAVVAKPAGLLTHSAPGPSRATLVAELSARMPLAPAAGEGRAGILHRLDKDTSGLLVVAKTDRAYRSLVDSMKARRIRRTYETLVSGSFRLPRGRVQAPIGRSPGNPTVMSVTPAGKPATTDFEVVEDLGDLSHLKVDLLTGRTHQIRVHLAHIRHPVVGDEVYGKPTLGAARRLGLERPFLHASRISFAHPFRDEEVVVEEPLPEELEQALERARVEAGARR
ncbi:MAG: RluA family pseudouridine synthase [Actinomycetota bacterium]|nr:RluA family pseudouridine synthase [Actinomycetota bacterium]